MKMITKNTKRMMSIYKANALRYAIIGDKEAQEKEANKWRSLAKESQASKAPKYLNWTGR